MAIAALYYSPINAAMPREMDMAYTFASLSDAKQFARAESSGAVELPSARMVDGFIDWLSSTGFSGLVLDDGFTVGFGR